MIRLTQLVFLFKKYRKLVVLSAASFVALVFIAANWNAIIKAIVPVKPPPETVAFGLLPQYDLSDGIKPSVGVNFKLQTITGNLPSLPKNAKVFQIAKKTPSFATEESIKDKALSLSFNREPHKITGSVMEFTGSKEIKNLIFDTLTGNFVMSYRLEPQIIETKPRSIVSDKRSASSFFQIMGLDIVQYPEKKVLTKNLKFENNNIVEADSLSNAQMIEVDFHFTDIDNLPTHFVKKGSSAVFALVANGRVVYAKKESPNIELFRFATYPLKPVSQAWEELKSGKAVFNSENSSSTIDIKDVKLGYVIVYKNNQYIQPVYLFLGEGDFIAFVPAISDKWVEKL